MSAATSVSRLPHEGAATGVKGDAVKTYMHDERHRIEEGWAMGRPPRPIEPDYDGDGEPIFDDGKLVRGLARRV